MSGITFKPKAVSKKLLTALNPRTREIVINRYGLDKETRMTAKEREIVKARENMCILIKV